jgi:single-strand DNA-binding protein
MASMALVTVKGNLGKDPEVRVTPNGKTNVRFSVAVSKKQRDGSESTAWYVVTCWGGLAETMVDFTEKGWIAKGSPVLVAGRLEPREYEQNGATRMSLDVTANEVLLLGDRRGDGGGGGGGGQSQDYRDVEDIPF